jgi:hypothetical protein
MKESYIRSSCTVYMAPSHARAVDKKEDKPEESVEKKED